MWIAQTPNRLEGPVPGILTYYISPSEQLASFPERCVIDRQKSTIKNNLKRLMSTPSDIQKSKLGSTSPD